MSLLTVEKYSHFVKITSYDARTIKQIKSLINEFYTQFPFNVNANNVTPPKVFAGVSPNGTEFWLHINQMKHLYNDLKFKGYKEEDIEVIDKTAYETSPIDAKVKEAWTPREDQIPVINYIIENDRNIKLVPMQTGKGKTFCALSAIAQIKERTVIIVLPTYMEKWAGDITDILDTPSKNIMMVRGSKHLAGLIELGNLNELTSDFIIISSRTMQEYIQKFESDPYETIEFYGSSPDDLFKVLKAGVLLVDETHQHIHAIFKTIIHTNMHKHIGLSATLESDNRVIDRIHSVLYPKASRYPDTAYDKYVHVYSIGYNIYGPRLKQISTTERGSKFYSHNAFEKSIIRNRLLKNNYFTIITNTLHDYYDDGYIKGDRAAIYVSTVLLATELTEYIKNEYPHLDVRRYCEDDPFENVIEPDIRITTIISSGTAIDIKNLTTVILTQNVSSTVANLQVLGRLRKIEGRDVKFCFLWCNQIGKHIEYTRKKKELLRDKALTYVDRSSLYSL